MTRVLALFYQLQHTGKSIGAPIPALVSCLWEEWALHLSLWNTHNSFYKVAPLGSTKYFHRLHFFWLSHLPQWDGGHYIHIKGQEKWDSEKLNEPPTVSRVVNVRARMQMSPQCPCSGLLYGRVIWLCHWSSKSSLFYPGISLEASCFSSKLEAWSWVMAHLEPPDKFSHAGHAFNHSCAILFSDILLLSPAPHLSSNLKLSSSPSSPKSMPFSKFSGSVNYSIIHSGAQLIKLLLEYKTLALNRPSL